MMTDSRQREDRRRWQSELVDSPGPPTDRAQGPRYATLVALAAGATFLAILDATVANLAVANLGRTFRSAAVADLSWVVSLYAILFAAFLAPGGRLADVIGAGHCTCRESASSS